MGGIYPNSGLESIPSSGIGGYHLQSEVLECYEVDHCYPHYYTVIKGGRLIKTESDTEVNFEKFTGRILKIMQANDLEIKLPKSEWPPFPTGPFLFPWQK
jgi:hypothetical protein